MALFLLITMVISLAACQQNTESESEENTETNLPTESVTLSAGSDQSVELTMAGDEQAEDNPHDETSSAAFDQAKTETTESIFTTTAENTSESTSADNESPIPATTTASATADTTTPTNAATTNAATTTTATTTAAAPTTASTMTTAMPTSSAAATTQAETSDPSTIKAAQIVSTGISAAIPDGVASFAAELGIGWNLGNSLEASYNGTPSETAWGNPKVTTTLLSAVKSAGFKTVRIPVSYLDKIDDDNGYTIDPSWLARVREVVDMCRALDLNVIINIHGDGYKTVTGGWLYVDGSDQTTIKAKYAAVWTQIANTFKDYDEHVVFEGMNEIFDGTYSAPNSTYYQNLMDYNQIFVDTVRATGGNNATRYLMVPGWNTDITYTVDSRYGFALPTDSTANRLILSVHYYGNYDYTGSGNVDWWGKYAAAEGLTVDTWSQESYVNSQFKKLYDSYVSKGIPVIIGEMGACYQSAEQESNRAYYIGYVVRAAKDYGLVPVIWDNGATKAGAEGFGIFTRSNGSVVHAKYLQAIMQWE